jgi:thymidylate synthase
MVNAWNVGELDQMVLPPCHYGFQVYTRELSIEERLDLGYKTYKELFEPFDFYKVDHEEIDKLYPVPRRAISLMWNQRSCDVGLGIPFNIASYGLLLEIIARSVDMIPYELIGNLGDCHIYSNHIDGVKEQLNRKPYPLPTLKINSGNENWHLLEVDEIINSFDPDLTFKVENYQSHPSIKLPLSN